MRVDDHRPAARIEHRVLSGAGTRQRESRAVDVITTGEPARPAVAFRSRRFYSTLARSAPLPGVLGAASASDDFTHCPELKSSFPKDPTVIPAPDCRRSQLCRPRASACCITFRQPLTATELARTASITPPDTDVALLLVKARPIADASTGRHRYTPRLAAMRR